MVLLSVQLVVVLWLHLQVRLCSGWRCEGSPLVCQAVLTAGEEREETRRYELLLGLSHHVQEDAELSSELSDLLEVVDHWANGLENYWSNSSGDSQVTGEDGYLGGWFMFFALPWGVAWPHQPRPQSPLHPLWSLYRGRMLIWSAVENGFRYQPGPGLASLIFRVILSGQMISIRRDGAC